MNSARTLVALVLVPLVAGCASIQSKAVESESRRLSTEIFITTPEKVDVVSAKMTRALLDNQIGVSSSQGGVIEAKLPRELGFMGSYDIVVRAVVVPETVGSSVTLYGEEVGLGDTKDTETVMGGRLNAGSKGRALATWKRMLHAAESLQPDSTQRIVRAKWTPRP